VKHESRLLGPQIRFGHLQGPGCSVANARKLLFRRSGRINVNKLLEKTKEELLALLPPTIYFFIALHIVALVRALMAQGTGLPISSSVQIAMGALILGKAVLLADLLPAINRFPDKPLAYNVAWKTTIYFVIATFIHYLERLIDYWKHSGGFAAANERLLAEIVWPHFWAIQIILVVLIFNYCVVRELSRTIGADRMMELFFGRRGRVSGT
jgi:hypothetical protein